MGHPSVFLLIFIILKSGWPPLVLLFPNLSITLQNPLGIVPNAPIIAGITDSFIIHRIFSNLAKCRYLFRFSLIYSVRQVFLFLLTITSRLVEIKWSVCKSKSGRSLCVSCSRNDTRLCMYHLFIWSNFNFLHNSQWITFPTQSCLLS